ncbi:MAG: hypothetical protein Q4A61_00890 [Porphyromonadaceae bacterium]|nr:hypothetical protein [Porphyromonadaceae bacterium]
MITLTEAKTYLRVDEWYKDEDSHIQSLASPLQQLSQELLSIWTAEPGL